MSSQKSTIVRFKTAARILAIRSAFGTLERLAPSIGSRWAERLWLTIPPYRGKTTSLIPSGEPFTVRLGDQKIVGTAWGTGPVVYLVHGWGGASSQLHPFLAPLLAAGHRVVTFDALSHGDSDPGELGPRRTTLPEVAAALTAVAEVHGPAHAVIAHSFGAASTFFAMRNGFRTGRLVFLAPMTQPLPYTALFGAALGFGERIRTRMVDRVAQRVSLPWSAFDVPSHTIETPLLTMHDPNDRETRYADSVAVAKAWPNAELHTVHGLGHWRLLRDPGAVARAVEFVTARDEFATRSPLQTPTPAAQRPTSSTPHQRATRRAAG